MKLSWAERQALRAAVDEAVRAKIEAAKGDRRDGTVRRGVREPARPRWAETGQASSGRTARPAFSEPTAG